MRTITEQHQQFGSYRLLHILDSGGFADVYLAEHIYLKTLHAVKILQMHLFEEDQQRRFLEEARLIARLSHPHIIQVVDFGIEQAVPFLVMSYASHGNLRQLHPAGSRIPLATVIQYAKQIAEALQYAHDQHLIHRDIKPENVLLDEHNKLLLSDFGIAIVAHSSHSQSLQDVVGTANYMPPEQLRGRPRPASDQYALATLVYEWFCGVLPFDGATYLDIARQHLNTPAPLLTEKMPDISPAIAVVIQRALAKDSHQRFETIQAFADALEQAYLHDTLPEPASASDEQNEEYESLADLRGEQPREGRRPSRRLVLATLGGLSALAACGGYLGWQAVFGARSPLQVSTHRKVGSLPPLSGNIGKTVFIYNGLSNTQINSFEINTLAWSPDSTRIISAGSTTEDGTFPIYGKLTNWHAFSGNTLFTNNTYVGLGLPGYGHARGKGVAWSPDGTHLVTTTTTDLTWDSVSFAANFLDTATGQALMTIPITAHALAWTSDGKSLALVGPYADPNITITPATPVYLYKGTRIMRFDASNGQPTLSHYADSLYASNPLVVWSSHSRYLASYTSSVNTWDALHASQISSYSGSGSSPSALALDWSPDGSHIASSWGSEVHISSALTGQHVLTYSGHSQAVKAIAWSPDGSYIATGGDDNTVQIWEATNGTLLYTYRQHTDSLVALAWSPNGNYLASGGAVKDGTVRVWIAK